MSKKSKVYIPTDKEFKEIIKNNYSYSDCLRQLNLTTKGGSSFDILKKRIKELECDTSHFNRSINNTIRKSNKYYTIEEIMVKDSTYFNISRLKQRLLKKGILQYKCYICGNNGEWNNKPLSLQLDHIDGDNKNHTKENLRLLCPNCHSQTPTFTSKNIKNNFSNL